MIEKNIFIYIISKCIYFFYSKLIITIISLIKIYKFKKVTIKKNQFVRYNVYNLRYNKYNLYIEKQIK